MAAKRNLVAYMVGRFISFIGTGMQQVALPLYILDLTHSGTMMALFAVISIVPNLIAAPFAGILGDQRNRKHIMIITDYARGILVSILGFLAMGGNLNIYILFGIQIIISIMDSFFGASSTALLPELLDKEKLIKAMSLRGGLDAFSMIIGPVLGGVIYGFMGISIVFYIDGASFIISGIAAMLMIYISKTRMKGEITVKSFLKDNGEVLSFIKNNKGLMQLFSFIMCINLFFAPLISIVMPYIIKKGMGFSSAQFGYLMATFTIGILAGNIALGVGSNKLSSRIIMQASMTLQMVMFVILAIIVIPNIALYFGMHSWGLFIALALVMLLIGFFNAGLNTPLMTNLQNMVPNKMRSRFFAVLGMICQGAVPIGAVLYGLLLDRFPYHYILLVIMIITSMITALFMTKAVPEVYEPASILEQ